MKFYVILAVCASLVACTTHTTSVEEENKKLVQQMFDAFNRHDWKTMADHYDESSQFLDPAFGIDYVTQTRKDIAKKYGEMEVMFPDIHDEVVSLYASGDAVIAEFISTGTSADGTSFKLPICSVLTLKNKYIVRDATYYNASSDESSSN